MELSSYKLSFQLLQAQLRAQWGLGIDLVLIDRECCCYKQVTRFKFKSQFITEEQTSANNSTPPRY